VSGSRRRQNESKRPQRSKGQPADLWRKVPEPAAPEPISPTAEPSGLIDSLGPPPLQGQAGLAAQYFAAVIERSAMLANALASSAGLLGHEGESDGPTQQSP
jgi:hypothetical protein